MSDKIWCIKPDIGVKLDKEYRGKNANPCNEITLSSESYECCLEIKEDKVKSIEENRAAIELIDELYN